jgi:hypothetical protein
VYAAFKTRTYTYRLQTDSTGNATFSALFPRYVSGRLVSNNQIRNFPFGYVTADWIVDGVIVRSYKIRGNDVDVPIPNGLNAAGQMGSVIQLDIFANYLTPTPCFCSSNPCNSVDGRLFGFFVDKNSAIGYIPTPPQGPMDAQISAFWQLANVLPATMPTCGSGCCGGEYPYETIGGVTSKFVDPCTQPASKTIGGYCCSKECWPDAPFDFIGRGACVYMFAGVQWCYSLANDKIDISVNLALCIYFDCDDCQPDGSPCGSHCSLGLGEIQHPGNCTSANWQGRKIQTISSLPNPCTSVTNFLESGFSVPADPDFPLCSGSVMVQGVRTI